MKLNKKGLGTVPTIWLALVGVNLLIISPLTNVTANFRERKGIEQCVSEGSLQEACEILIEDMGKKELLAYIKDDDMTGNRGFAK